LARVLTKGIGKRHPQMGCNELTPQQVVLKCYLGLNLVVCITENTLSNNGNKNQKNVEKD
jgi:hypothetical protein